jgi:hypothetical protein
VKKPFKTVLKSISIKKNDGKRLLLICFSKSILMYHFFPAITKKLKFEKTVLLLFFLMADLW